MTPDRTGRWRRGLLGVAALAALLAMPSPAPRPVVPPAAAATVPSAAPTALVAPSTAPIIPTGISAAETEAAARAEADAVAEAAADRRAGVPGAAVPAAGTGILVAVPGAAPAPAPGPSRTVRVEVEGGLPVDAPAFAEFVTATLNDPRGWGQGLGATFARTDGAADVVVVLASPRTSEELCRPLVTEGIVSCRAGNRAVITYMRWVAGAPDYGRDRTGYRQYVINHEVGHVFGNVHVNCPGPGRPAPVMQQQTLGLQGCAPNPWPYP